MMVRWRRGDGGGVTMEGLWRMVDDGGVMDINL